jgi:hypothetical protein
MKKLVLVLIGMMAFPSISSAQQIGPGIPANNLPGHVATPNYGVGYNYRQAEYDNFEIEEHRVYLHLGAALGNEVTPAYEVFLRLGAATLEDGDDFHGGVAPMYAAGMKAEFHTGKTFGWGGVIQGLYIDKYEDRVHSGNQQFDLSLEDNWDLELAFPVHAKINHGLVYLGPVIYHSSADVVAKAISQSERNVTEDRDVGVFGGVVIRSKNVSVEVEGKYKSDFSVGALVSFTL